MTAHTLFWDLVLSLNRTVQYRRGSVGHESERGMRSNNVHIKTHNSSLYILNIELCVFTFLIEYI